MTKPLHADGRMPRTLLRDCAATTQQQPTQWMWTQQMWMQRALMLMLMRMLMLMMMMMPAAQLALYSDDAACLRERE
jgi:hypothetical protein